MSSARSQSHPPIIEIHWRDASYNSARAMSTDEAAQDGDYKLTNCGYLIAEDKDEVHIGAEFSPKDKTWRHVIHIPKPMIIKRNRIR